MELNNNQADAVLSMPIKKLTNLERQQITKDIKALKVTKKKLREKSEKNLRRNLRKHPDEIMSGIPSRIPSRNVSEIQSEIPPPKVSDARMIKSAKNHAESLGQPPKNQHLIDKKYKKILIEFCVGFRLGFSPKLSGDLRKSLDRILRNYPDCLRNFSRCPRNPHPGCPRWVRLQEPERKGLTPLGRFSGWPQALPKKRPRG